MASAGWPVRIRFLRALVRFARPAALAWAAEIAWREGTGTPMPFASFLLRSVRSASAIDEDGAQALYVQRTARSARLAPLQ